MLAQIYVYRDKRGKFRWNVSTNSGDDGDNVWNIKCAGTDPHNTMSDAEIEARIIICRAWELDVEYDPSCYQIGPISRLLKFLVRLWQKVVR